MIAHIDLDLPGSDVGRIVTSLGWMAEELSILRESYDDYTEPTDDFGAPLQDPEDLEQEIQAVRDLCAHLHDKLEAAHVEDE